MLYSHFPFKFSTLCDSTKLRITSQLFCAFQTFTTVLYRMLKELSSSILLMHLWTKCITSSVVQWLNIFPVFQAYLFVSQDISFHTFHLVLTWIMFIFISSFQSRCRQFLAHSYYKRLKKAAVVTQCAWRGRLARRELRKLKMVSIFIYFINLPYFLMSLFLK